MEAKFPIFACGDVGSDIKLPDGAVLLVGEAEMDNHACSSNAHFRRDLYLNKLRTTQFGRFLLWSPCLPSTHTLLSQNFHSFPLGTVCIADTQSQGKGRSSNVWESPRGCLMFSFTLQMENGRLLPFVQYVASIALVDAVESICSEKGLPILPVNIKWPNDIYTNGMKIGGVLCTSTYSEKKFNVVIGIGLNVANQEPTICLNKLLEDLGCNTSPFQREELLAVFFKKFEDLFGVLSTEGFVPLESTYYRKWLHSGQCVLLEEMQDDNTSVKVPLVIQGLSPSGFLLAVDDHMEKYELHPDGNSFDFLRGLIRKKL